MPLESVVDRLEKPQIRSGSQLMNDDEIKQFVEKQIKPGCIAHVNNQLTSLDVIDIVQKSINVGKLNNSTKLKILNNVIKELKEFYK